MATDNEQSQFDNQPAQDTPQFVTGGHTNNKHRMAVILGLVVLVILMAITAYLFFSSRYNGPTDSGDSSAQLVISSVCTDDIIRTASPQIANNDITGLEKTANKIKSLENYRGDVNCNYILERYYIMIGDIDNAKSTLSDLRHTYASVGGYSLKFDPPAVAISSLEQFIETLVEQREQEAERYEQMAEMDGDVE